MTANTSAADFDEWFGVAEKGDHEQVHALCRLLYGETACVCSNKGQAPCVPKSALIKQLLAMTNPA